MPLSKSTVTLSELNRNSFGRNRHELRTRLLQERPGAPAAPLRRDKEAVRLGLRCKMCLRQGKWKEAEQVWQLIEDKSSPVHIGLRFETLQQKIADLTTSPGERADAQAELQSIQKKNIIPLLGGDTEPDVEVDQEVDDDTATA